MKKVTFIKLNGCPYCANAEQAIQELKSKNPQYAAIQIDEIEETEQPELAKPCGKYYYYVPTMFVDNKKIYEAHPGESYEDCLASVKKVFDSAVSA